MSDKKLGQLRRNYDNCVIADEVIGDDPFVLFEEWLQKSIDVEPHDPTAMVLSTVDEQLRPDSRVVLLKAVQANRLLFYTNYTSHKAQQLKANAQAALNFFWPGQCRQIRVRGEVHAVSQAESADYFATRPKSSQIGALASRQSQVTTRAALEQRFRELDKVYKDKAVPCPDFWGGYALVPCEFEFWQGLANRLHDRFHFSLNNSTWHRQRLAP